MNEGFLDLALLRNEHRFFLLPEVEDDFLVALRQRWEEIRFSDNLHVLTVYLQSDEHDIPFGASVKFRQFLSEPLSSVPAHLPGLVRFEVKRTRHDTERTKTPPALLTAELALREARAALGIPTLRPYLAVQYKRHHFIPRDGTSLRVTLDRDTTYGFFSHANADATPLGRESILRVEVKIPVSDVEFPAWVQLREELARHGAMPIVSKSIEGCARIGNYLTQCYGLPIVKDLPGYEIEAKLLVHHEDPSRLFREIKEWTRHETEPILLARHFPFTVDGESVNQYWAETSDGKTVDGLKILLHGDQFSTVLKSETALLDVEFGIVRRREMKGKPVFYTPQDYGAAVERWREQASQPRFLGHLTRWRRAIWPEETTSRRIYHVSLDRCVAAVRQEPLWQIEIEYVGRLQGVPAPGGDLERTVVTEIQYLVRRLLDRANRDDRRVLVPTTLTKFQWLAGL